MDKFNAMDMFLFFKKQYPDTDVTYTLYKHILSEFFKKVSIEILDGATFGMGHKLGTVRIRKIERNPDFPSIDWGETRKLNASGEKGFVYFTDDHWFRWSWEKSKAPLKNKSVYRFSPTAGKNGNKKMLVRKLKTDPFAELNYRP